MKEKKITKDRLLHMLVRALPMIIVLALLAGTALWINRPKEGETAADSSRMVYAPARVTAVLSDNAQEDFENAEGRRVGDQELEIDQSAVIPFSVFIIRHITLICLNIAKSKIIPVKIFFLHYVSSIPLHYAGQQLFTVTIIILPLKKIKSALCFFI